MNLDQLPPGYVEDPDGVARRRAAARPGLVVELPGLEPAAGKMAEKVWQAKVVAEARRQGWRWYHTHRSDRSPAGFPDLCLVRPPRLLFAELKTERGKPTPEQSAWLADLAAAGQECHLWRPSDWPTVVTTLAQPQENQP